MTQLLEQFKMGENHQDNDPKCPFCPQQAKEEHYKTYGGAANDGDKLGRLLDEPEKFGTSTEPDARPKDGKPGKDGRINQSFLGSESLKSVKGEDKDWKFQAHHAISGNQCLKNNDVETYIIEGGKVKYDTGYSVNNPQNGIWLPSFPEAGVAWPQDPVKKFELAKVAMKKFERQFHLGHHKIDVDTDGLDPKTDSIYTEYIAECLKELHTILSDWEAHCPQKTADGKHVGNPQIHNALDHISKHIIALLKGAPKKWTIYVSRHARDWTIKSRDPNSKLDFEK